MKKNAYIHDITDTFGDDSTSKNALSIAKKIKSAQKKAFPSIEFKQHLWDRLSNIYALQSADDIVPKFSLMQLFWAFASFIFIAGWVFGIYQMKEITGVEIQGSEEIISIPDNSYDIQWAPSEQLNIDDTSTNQDNLWEESQSIQVENDVFEQRYWNQSQDQEIIPEITELDNIPKSDINQNQTDVRMMRSMQFDENNIESWINQDFAPENMMDARMWESSLYMVESMENENIENIPNVFSDLCETYMWEYNFDTQICTLQYGTQCQEYDEDSIFQCYSRDNSLSE